MEDVKQDSSTSEELVKEEDVKTEEAEAQEEQKPEIPEGYVRHEALVEERSKRRELERKIKELEETQSSDQLDDEVYSDEAKALKKEVDSLKQELGTFKTNSELETLRKKYPVIEDKSEEFDEFRGEYHNVSLDKVARLFALEYDPNAGETLKRKGLEKPTGGSKKPVKSGWSAEDVKRLRENEYRKYMQMIKDGKLKPEDIHD